MKKLLLLLFSCCTILLNAQEINEQNFQQYQDLAKNGDAEAQYQLASYYFQNEEYDEGWYWGEESTKKGNANAQYLLGVAYSYGYGIPENKDKAVEFFNLAAKQNHPKALFMIGCYYADMNNAKKANAYFKKSADLNCAEGQYFYGQFRIAGLGGKANLEEAAENIEKSALQGYLPAIYIIGTMYLEGLYYDVDITKGLSLVEIAAKANYADAQFLLGCVYFYNEYNVPCNYAIAAQWLTLAAENGKFHAYNNLAYYYAYGHEDLPADLDKAHELIDKAIENDPNEATFYDSKGEFYIMQGDKENAQKMWDKVIELDPKFPKTSGLYKSLYENNGVWVGKTF